MKNKTLGFKFEPVCAKQTRINYSVVSDQDEGEIQYDRLSIQEWCNCEKCEKISTSLECLCCHGTPKNNWFKMNTVTLKFFAVEFNFEGNHFLAEFPSEI